MSISDVKADATISSNIEETLHFTEPIDLETADYHTLLSVPHIRSKRAKGIMAMRKFSRLSISNVTDVTGLKEEVIVGLMSSGRILHLPQDYEGVEKVFDETDDLEEIRHGLRQMNARMLSMERCVTELHITNGKLKHVDNEAIIQHVVAHTLQSVDEICKPQIADCTKAIKINFDGLTKVQNTLPDLQSQMHCLREHTQQDFAILQRNMKFDLRQQYNEFVAMNLNFSCTEEMCRQQHQHFREQGDKYLQNYEDLDKRWKDISENQKKHEETLQRTISSVISLRLLLDEHIKSCTRSKRTSCETRQPKTVGYKLSSMTTTTLKQPAIQLETFSSTASSSVIKTSHKLEKGRSARHNKGQTDWMKDPTGKVLSEIRPTQEIQHNHHHHEGAMKANKRDPEVSLDTFSTTSKGLQNSNTGAKSHVGLSSDDVGNPASGVARDYLYLDREQNHPIHLSHSDTGVQDLAPNIALDWGARSKLDKPRLLPLSAGTPLQRSQSSGYSTGDNSLDPPIGGNQSAVEERKCQPCDVPHASPTSTRDMASILGHSGIYETSRNTKPNSASDITDSDSSDQLRADWQRHQSSTGGLDHHQHEQSPIMPLSSPSSKPRNMTQGPEITAKSITTPDTEKDIATMIEEAIKKSFATEMQKVYRRPLSPNRSPSPGFEPGGRIGDCFHCKRPGHFRRDCPELSGNLPVIKND